MPSPLAADGSTALHMGRFSTGLWTNRSALRDAATPYYQEKFSGIRGDSLWGGQNTEISTRLTLIRRPGNSVYNGGTFPAINRFYEFRAFSTSTENIFVMADTATDVRNATGPATNAVIRTKSVGAGATSFQSVGNTLYMGDGRDQTKWVQSSKSWQPSTAYQVGDYILDPGGFLQVVTGAQTAAVVTVYIGSNVVSIGFRGPSPFPAGVNVTPSGLTNYPALNGVSLPVTAVTQNGIQATYVAPDYAVAGDTGTVSNAAPTTTGPLAPIWNENPSQTTVDGGILWTNKGSSVQAWGTLGPSKAPTVSLANLPTIYPRWSANTLYSTSLLVVGSNGSLQALTHSGTTGAAEPAWPTLYPTGTVTTDGTAQWTNRGQAAWRAGTDYGVGAVVSVTFTYYVTSPDPGDGSGGQQTPVTATDFFEATQSGLSDNSPPPAWVDGVGTMVSDGLGLIWTNRGASVTWPGGIGANQALSLVQAIVDANGTLQMIQASGRSGAAHPVWAMGAGSTTTDGSATWIAGAPYAVAANQAQTYSYAWGNSLTGEKGNASPISSPVKLAANTYVILQGAGPADPNDDTIYLYRTLKGGSTQFQLDSIPAPPSGQMWTYYDTSTDDALVIEVQAATALQLSPPPAGAIAPSYHLQRIFVAVLNVLSWSAGPDAILYAANGASGFPPANVIVFPSKIVRTWPCALGLLVFTVSDIYIVLGSATPGDPLYATPFLEGIGLLSYDSFTVRGTTVYLITTSLQLISLDPSSGVTEVGFPIADQIESLFSASSHLAFHSQSSRDTALYAGDGMVGWFRMAPTSAPESGFNWSTRAIVTGGCTALSSIEVTPGQKRLLLGPQYSGPILMRDVTTRTDAGVPYVCTTEIGSIVLATPGQLAQLAFLTLESVRVGSTAQLGLLLGEVAGTYENIHRTRQDPPLLPPSTSLMGDRYHVVQNGAPAVCRHFLMRIAWPAEDAANELITYTVNGTLTSERAGS